MFNLEYIANEHNEDHNKKWLYIPDHLYRILTIWGSGSGKTDIVLNSIKEQDNDNLIVRI